ncbi:von Willebrand factor type A domain-containing protein [Streptomyces sp. NPDC088354]|uniref:vWA domain-containing protein n=1 Tax=Streptomyces sp. NPDC088354 TaxID=3365856 RepID=UPI0037FDC346
MRRTAGTVTKAVTAAIAVTVATATLAGCGAVGPRGNSHDAGPRPAPARVAQGTQAPDGERAPARDELSTFALDVDTASYGYAKRQLGNGELPEPSAVRYEEFVNSFRQDYPSPDGDGFSVTADGARTPGAGSRWSLLRIGLATRPADKAARKPAALTFVVDVSGSMAEPGRLDLVQKALRSAVGELRGDDSLSVVTFSERARVALPMTRLGADGARAHAREVIDGLRPEQSTNLEAGLRAGYDVALEGARAGVTNRVVLLSDALANTGETEPDALLERIDRARREHGVTLYGVGVGSEYGDALMEELADKGDGHTSYVSTEGEARALFVDQLPANVELRARDAKAQVAFDEQTVERYRLIGFEDRAVADEDFRDDAVDGGEVGPGHTVTALYAVRLRPGARGHVATATVRWLDPASRAPHEESAAIEADRLAAPLWDPATSPRLRVDAVAAYFADALRTYSTGDEQLPGAPGLAELADRARALADTTEDPAVADLAESVDRAYALRAA